FGGGADAGPVTYLARQVEPIDDGGVLVPAPLGLRQHPHHLELVAVGVRAVDALGRAVAGLSGVGVETRQGGSRLLELLDGVDLPGQVVEPERSARTRRLIPDPEE